MASTKIEVAKRDTGLKLVIGYLGDALRKADVEVLTVENTLSKLTLNSGSSVEGHDALALELCDKAGRKDLVGKDPLETALIRQWTMASINDSGDAGKSTAFAKEANDQLVKNTYLVNNRFTLADIVVFANVHPWVRTLAQPKQVEFYHLVRWFDLIQHTIPTSVREQAQLENVAINPDECAKSVLAAMPAPAAKAGSAEGKKNKNKDKEGKAAEGKDKSKAKTKAPKPKPVAEVKPITPSQLDLRVGKIIECDKHPNADALYVEKIDAGEEELRTVVSGLVRFIPLDQMLNREVVLVCNLKPAAMRGIKSYAMVLCATSADGNSVEFVEPPPGSKPGTKVYFEGFKEGEPEAVLNPKKKIWETIQPGLLTNENLQALYQHPEGKVHLMMTDEGVCTVKSAAKGTIK
ncbi:G4 quadruplex nucleic acid binding protein [Dispira parvispora]|uniref:G4 quadruplex nucleic acid binding protein n=1 Tax=Dispira parvispora TaxID=1520584 RepID=A0A9W8AUJ0_9FUNG|nr:G4 quadruplex nucleic acid binding protein [Dispira parvispora]